MYTRIVNYKNALTCKVVILKNAIADINKKTQKTWIEVNSKLESVCSTIFWWSYNNYFKINTGKVHVKLTSESNTKIIIRSILSNVKQAVKLYGKIDIFIKCRKKSHMKTSCPCKHLWICYSKTKT